MLPSAPSESQYLLKKKKKIITFHGKTGQSGWKNEREGKAEDEREKRLMHSEEGVTNEHREWEFNRLFKTKTALLMYVEQGKPRREKACRRGREVAKLARNINVEREKDYSKPRSK